MFPSTTSNMSAFLSLLIQLSSHSYRILPFPSTFCYKGQKGSLDSFSLYTVNNGRKKTWLAICVPLHSLCALNQLKQAFLFFHLLYKIGFVPVSIKSYLPRSTYTLNLVLSHNRWFITLSLLHHLREAKLQKGSNWMKSITVTEANILLLVATSTKKEQLYQVRLPLKDLFSSSSLKLLFQGSSIVFHTLWSSKVRCLVELISSAF